MLEQRVFLWLYIEKVFCTLPIDASGPSLLEVGEAGNLGICIAVCCNLSQEYSQKHQFHFIFQQGLPGCQLSCLRTCLKVVINAPGQRGSGRQACSSGTVCSRLLSPGWPSPFVSPLPFGDTNPTVEKGWVLLALFPTVDWQPGVPGNDRSHNAPSSRRWRASPL